MIVDNIGGDVFAPCLEALASAAGSSLSGG
jgi:hypothetical protein